MQRGIIKNELRNSPKSKLFPMFCHFEVSVRRTAYQAFQICRRNSPSIILQVKYIDTSC